MFEQTLNRAVLGPNSVIISTWLMGHVVRNSPSRRFNRQFAVAK